MGKYTGADVGFILVGGYSILGAVTQFTDKLTAQAEESHALGSSWVEKTFVGVRSGEWTQNGFFDDAAGSVNEALAAGLATSKILTYTVETNAAGKNFVGFSGALAVDFTKSPARGALTKAAANYQGNGIIEEGKILHALTGRTASGNTSAAAVDFGTSNTTGGFGYFQLTSFTSGAGTTALAVDIMDSPDNLTFTSRMAFTPATAAPLAERKAFGSAIQRYAAVKWSGASGAGAPASCTFFVGLART